MMHPAFFFTSGTRALSVFSTLLDYFAYDFVRNALIAGVLISLCAGLLGVVLVLKRYSMIGDGLSHVAFGAMAVAAVLGWAPMAAALPVTVGAARTCFPVTGDISREMRRSPCCRQEHYRSATCF